MIRKKMSMGATRSLTTQKALARSVKGEGSIRRKGSTLDEPGAAEKGGERTTPHQKKSIGGGGNTKLSSPK